MTMPVKIDRAALDNLVRQDGSIDRDALSPADLIALREALRPRPGERSPETEIAIAERGRSVRELAARFYPGLSRHRQAMAIGADLRRYAGLQWVRTRSDQQCRHPDDRQKLFWKILKSRGGHVPSVRTCDDILAGRS